MHVLKYQEYHPVTEVPVVLVGSPESIMLTFIMLKQSNLKFRLLEIRNTEGTLIREIKLLEAQ